MLHSISTSTKHLKLAPLKRQREVNILYIRQVQWLAATAVNTSQVIKTQHSHSSLHSFSYAVDVVKGVRLKGVVQNSPQK